MIGREARERMNRSVWAPISFSVPLFFVLGDIYRGRLDEAKRLVLEPTLCTYPTLAVQPNVYNSEVARIEGSQKYINYTLSSVEVKGFWSMSRFAVDLFFLLKPPARHLNVRRFGKIKVGVKLFRPFELINSTSKNLLRASLFFPSTMSLRRSLESRNRPPSKEYPSVFVQIP